MRPGFEVEAETDWAKRPGNRASVDSINGNLLEDSSEKMDSEKIAKCDTLMFCSGTKSNRNQFAAIGVGSWRTDMTLGIGSDDVKRSDDIRSRQWRESRNQGPMRNLLLVMV
jgi:hypothetical protein